MGSPVLDSDKEEKMKTAILVTGLKTELVRRTDFARYHPVSELRPLLATDGQLLETCEPITVTERIVPITQFCFGNGNPDLYVAYSHEVEELLGIPFRIILQEKATAEREARQLRSMTAWQHIKIAFNLILSWAKS